MSNIRGQGPSFLNRWGVHQYETGWLRYPTTDEIVLPDGGRRQEFQGGVIYVAFQNAVGSAMPNGPIRDKYNSVGGLAPGGTLLGYPTQDQAPLPDGQGQMDRFQNGVIYWHLNHGAHPITGDIQAVWQQSGYESGQYGYPISDQLPNEIGGMFQAFQRGEIESPISRVKAAFSCIDVALRAATEGGITAGFQFMCLPFGVVVTAPGGAQSFAAPNADELSRPKSQRAAPSTVECDVTEPTNLSGPYLIGARVNKDVALCFGEANEDRSVKYSRTFRFTVSNVLKQRTVASVQTRLTSTDLPNLTFNLYFRVREDKPGIDRTVTDSYLTNGTLSNQPAETDYTTPRNVGTFFVEVTSLSLRVPEYNYYQQFGGFRFALGRYKCPSYSGQGEGDLCQFTNPVDDHT